MWSVVTSIWKEDKSCDFIEKTERLILKGLVLDMMLFYLNQLFTQIQS